MEFWNKIYARKQAGRYSRVEMPDLDHPVLQRALKHFGRVEDKTVIDLGCGSGASSLFFACHGARVLSVDLSETAIANLATYCRKNGIRNVTPLKMSAHKISELENVDFVFGSMILHHIEPFHEFARSLRRTIKPGGKGFFWENNASSKLMIWFRQNIVGKWWVPKYGDPDEFPLTPDEVGELRKYFHVEIEYPELVLMRLISAYLLRDRFKRTARLLDDYFYRYPVIRKYSYRQYLCLS